LRLTVGVGAEVGAETGGVYLIEVPGEIVAPEWGIRVRILLSAAVQNALEQASGAKQDAKKTGSEGGGGFNPPQKPTESTRALAPEKGSAVISPETSSFSAASGRQVVLRNWRPGDRVQLRHSGGPRKVKEVLERLRVYGSARARWPVVELGGRIVWMQGVELEPEAGIELSVSSLEESGSGASKEG
jgi:tRNA(Ile)-lysidine synthetase-like protein